MRTSIATLDTQYKSTNSRYYDICVITAANEYQAQGYREQIKSRVDSGKLPQETKFIVISDPQGKRIGSGGSTIFVLYNLLEYFCELENNKYSSVRDLLSEKRILILHSGGDSKRLPAYSTVGKAFIPLPINSFQPSEPSKQSIELVALFDLLLYNLMRLPYLSDGHLVIASGDVLLSFDANEVNFCDHGVTGLSYPGSIEVASDHGVYIAPQDSLDQNTRNVKEFLQKPTYDQLLQNDALDVSNMAFVDTGVMNFSIDALECLAEASGIYIEDGKVLIGKDSLCSHLINGNANLDIYTEFPFALLNKNVEIPGFQDSESFVTKLKTMPFFVCLLSYCGFFHVGTSKHLLRSFHTFNHTASMYGFQNFIRTKITDNSEIKEAFIYNTLIDTPSIKANKFSFIEGCYLDGNIELSGENIITNIPKCAGDIKLEKGLCITCVPVNRQNGNISDSTVSDTENGWVSVIYGVEDDFKKLANDPSATFNNNPFSIWMESLGIGSNDLWNDGESQKLWNAKIFPFSTDIKESVRLALKLQIMNCSNIAELDDWKKTPRMSLEDILQSIDYKRFLDNYSNLRKKINLKNLTKLLTPKNNLSSKEILSWCKEPEDYDTAEKDILALVNQIENPIFQARLYKLLSSIADESRYPEKSDMTKSEKIAYYEDTAFEFVRKAIKKGLDKNPIGIPQELKIRIRSDEVVWVCASTRLDFAGGWSDTPPYCLEYGGNVLNVAVKLNGQYPIQVIGKLHQEPYIKFNSIDLGKNAVITELDDMLSYHDPSDWLSLPKAAFITTGIIPDDSELSLQSMLKKLGAGIDLTLFSAVPSGSGLGTSSILGSAAIACISRILGQKLTLEELFNRTLYMEQLMTTGGGWQDQIGGVVGGVKYIQTKPDLYQTPKISWTDLKIGNDMVLSERFLLYYTGYRRMAKNILKNIVGKYLDRDETTIRTIGQLREKSFEMKEELDHRNIDAFGKMIAEVWELNKTLDPGTSNEDIESIIAKISHLIFGAKLLGAGGGGFLFIVTKGTEESNKIREILEKEPPNDRARFFDFEIDQEGLKVSVL
jgi:fucokinase